MLKNILFFVGIITILIISQIYTPQKEKVSEPSEEIHNLVGLEQQLTTPVTFRETLQLDLKIYEPSLVQPGNILLPVSGTAEVYLIDHELNILNSWPIDVERTRLSKDCKLGAILASKWGETTPLWTSLKGLFIELDWDSNLDWYYQSEDILHHDFQYLDNNNILLLRRQLVDQTLRKKEYRDVERWNAIRADLVFEINRQKETVWSWESWKHLDINTCGQRTPCIFHHKDKPRKNIRGQDWTHGNAVSLLKDNRWHQAGDERFKPGNLVFMARNLYEMYILDADSGKVVWQYSGEPGNKIIYGHEPHMIEQGLPGAGNILFFDNGGAGRKYSIINEVNPVTKKIVWSYKDGKNFFSPSGGSVQRLANGNTFISGDNGGNVFEVTKTGQVVWQVRSNSRIFRAHKYSSDLCEDRREGF